MSRTADAAVARVPAGQGQGPHCVSAAGRAVGQQTWNPQRSTYYVTFGQRPTPHSEETSQPRNCAQSPAGSHGAAPPAVPAPGRAWHALRPPQQEVQGLLPGNACARSAHVTGLFSVTQQSSMFSGAANGSPVPPLTSSARTNRRGRRGWQLPAATVPSAPGRGDGPSPPARGRQPALPRLGARPQPRPSPGGLHWAVQGPRRPRRPAWGTPTFT